MNASLPCIGTYEFAGDIVEPFFQAMPRLTIFFFTSFLVPNAVFSHTLPLPLVQSPGVSNPQGRGGGHTFLAPSRGLDKGGGEGTHLLQHFYPNSFFEFASSYLMSLVKV